MKREMKHVKKLGVILLLKKMKTGAKRKWYFVHIAVFEKLRFEKKFCKRANFFVHVRRFKAVFLVKRFGYNFF